MPGVIPSEFAPPPRYVTAAKNALFTGAAAAFLVGVAYVGWTNRHRFRPNHGKFDPVSKRQARQLGDEIGVDWDDIPIEQLRRGIEVEQEHWTTVDGDLRKIAEIAAAHIGGGYGRYPDDGISDYYTRLDKMEARAEAGMKPNRQFR
jgi:hypothetical protein